MSIIQILPDLLPLVASIFLLVSCQINITRSLSDYLRVVPGCLLVFDIKLYFRLEIIQKLWLRKSIIFYSLVFL